jgi:hypothetical protein
MVKVKVTIKVKIKVEKGEKRKGGERGGEVLKRGRGKSQRLLH